MAALRGALLAVIAALAPGATALAGPVWEVATGGTAAVLGGYDRSGASLSAAALWPIENVPVLPSARFGVMIHADDLGTRVVEMFDANDGTPLGRVATDHRDAWGGSWRLDAELPALGAWRPEAGATWGYYRVDDDLRGKSTGSLGTTGFSLAAGIGRPLGAASATAMVRYHRLFNDVAGRYMSLAVAWRFGGAPAR